MTQPAYIPMTSIPASYLELAKRELLERIEASRRRLGDELTILGHHYQSDTIYNVTDIQGDSYELAMQASESETGSDTETGPGTGIDTGTETEEPKAE